MKRRIMMLAAGAAALLPGETWAAVTIDPTKLTTAINLGKAKGGSGAIYVAGGRVGWWGDQSRKYDLKSSSKSFGSILLGLAIGQSRVSSLNVKAVDILASFGTPPSSNPSSWRHAATIRHLATHSAGFDKSGGFTQMLFSPGTKWSYSDGGANWLADLLTIKLGQDLKTVLQNAILQRIGATGGVSWRNNAYRPTTLNGIARREFGSGISASIDAMGRVGLLLLDGGRGIIPASYINQARQPISAIASLPQTGSTVHTGANKHYGLLFWNNGNGAMSGVPTDAYWSWGLGYSFILVVPSKRLVIARAGPAWHSPWGQFPTLQPFFKSVCTAIRVS